nr:MAG TPA: hypothetical protein [Caudoviricetes sp.]
MIISKGLAQKAERYETLKNEMDKLFEELEAWANDDYIQRISPKGRAL